MSATPVHIETLRAPEDYTPRQIKVAAQVAHILDRGRLLLTEKPGM